MTSTESSSLYDDLEKQSVQSLLQNINKEDRKVAEITTSVIPQITDLVKEIVTRMQSGGRLFYIGAGTSGRLGVLDASECPPTYGVDHNTVIGIIAGGDGAIRKAVENAEDDPNQGWVDLQDFKITEKDIVIGIAASGRTPYVIGGVTTARANKILTACITCNENTQLAEAVEYPIEVVVGPEFVTGSTRMKAGTAQKLVLNMISTTVMIQLGHVRGNKMVDMRLSNEKLKERAAIMVTQETGVSIEEARKILLTHDNVREAVQTIKQS